MILLPRDMAAIIPALIVPVFFYAVTIGALQDVAGLAAIGLDYKAFQLPLALVMTVTGISRAPSLVLDIQGGYFDRLLLTPVNRWALLLGMFVADTIVLLFLSLPVLAMGLALGVRFATGVAGIIVFVAITMVWGLSYTGFPYAIALRTGNPTAVNNSFLLFFPFVFLTPAWLPREAMTGWLAAIATWNPVTYILEGLADPVHRLGRGGAGQDPGRRGRHRRRVPVPGLLRPAASHEALSRGRTVAPNPGAEPPQCGLLTRVRFEFLLEPCQDPVGPRREAVPA